MNHLAAGAEPEGMLSGRQIEQRLRHPNLDERLVISPLMQPHVDEGTVDIRLGTKFIVTQKTGYPSVDPLDIAMHPFKIHESQKILRLPFGEELTLHPGQLVLGASFEYIKLPNDLASYVVTRSSYGRLGLVTATAIFVHPGFRGCITLELVNYGETPVVLSAGMRLAQLTIHKVNRDQPLKIDGKYNLPTGPEFPKLHKDEDDHRRLKAIQKQHKKRREKADQVALRLDRPRTH